MCSKKLFILLKVCALCYHSDMFVCTLCCLKQLEARHQVLDIMDNAISSPRSLMKDSTPCSCEPLWEWLSRFTLKCRHTGDTSSKERHGVQLWL